MIRAPLADAQVDGWGRDGTLHYTSPNSSDDRPRRAYIFNVATTAGIRGIAGRGTD